MSPFSITGISPGAIIPAVISVDRGESRGFPDEKRAGVTAKPSFAPGLFMLQTEGVLSILGAALLHTSPIIIVGIPAIIMAVMVAILCFSEGIPHKLQIRHTFFWLPLLAMVAMISVGAWQYVANALGIWPLVLVAVLAEGVFGYITYNSMRESQIRQDGKRGIVAVLYVIAMLALTSVGAITWSRGMEMTEGKVPFLGFFLVWTILFILALLVGKMAWHYMESGLKPILSSISSTRLTHQTELAVNKAVDLIRAKHAAAGITVSYQDVRMRLLHYVRELALMSGEKSPDTVSSSYLVDWYLQDVWPEDEQLHQRLERARQEPLKAVAKAEAAETAKRRRMELAQTAADGAFEVIVANLLLTVTSAQAVEIRGRIEKLANEYGPRENLDIDRLLSIYYQKFPDQAAPKPGNGKSSNRFSALATYPTRQVNEDDSRFE